MVQTKLANLIDPQVMANIISATLQDAIRFAPLATVDRTLVGQPGSTITVPRFNYIGDAKDVAEGAPIDLELLTTATDEFSIKKVGKGAELTDESVLSGYGDPVGETTNQLRMAIANKVDNDALEALDTTSLAYTAGTEFSVETIDAAQTIFNDEDQSSMVLIIHPTDAAALRADAAGQWERASDLGDQMLVSGAFGAVLGAQVIRSRKVEQGTAYLVKQGALGLYLKRDVEIETDRDIIHKTTVFTADQHYGIHLYDESKAVKIVVAGA
ncbi:N4-gp56 family major capsid protein [Planomicrobium soli]|uniref:N4-gp56 family major capsid protein n=1 Tax=Planomicrobium soli TaxID=1176648 RepID=A0A2P8H7D7_9BACL|nr:N4-gp56 family major capsid protein [Planomicrobium soli]PSL42132.1 N4-gp56 family major capsid protein [Planomicrobium soli]